jgi:hypothetical protein
LLKEKDLGVPHGIVPLVGDSASEDSAGRQAKTEVLGVMTGSSNDVGHIGFMRIESLDGVTAAAGHETVLAGSQVGEDKVTLRRGQESLQVVESSHGSEGDFGKAERLAAASVDNDAADAIGDGRGRSLGFQSDCSEK